MDAVVRAFSGDAAGDPVGGEGFVVDPVRTERDAVIRVRQAEQIAVVGAVHICLGDLKREPRFAGGELDRLQIRLEHVNILRSYPRAAQEFDETAFQVKSVAEQFKIQRLHFRVGIREFMGEQGFMEDLPRTVPHTAAVREQAQLFSVVLAPGRHFPECRQIPLNVPADVVGIVQGREIFERERVPEAHIDGRPDLDIGEVELEDFRDIRGGGRDDFRIESEFVEMPDDADDLTTLFLRECLVSVTCRVCQQVQLHAVCAAVGQIGRDAFFIVRLVIDFCAGVGESRPGEIDLAKSGREPLSQHGEGSRIVRFLRQVVPDGEFRSDGVC